MSEEEIENSQDAMLEKCARELGEHFDTVQIFVTRHDSEERGTLTQAFGLGNCFAIAGQINEWMMKKDARTKEIAKMEILDDLFED